MALKFFSKHIAIFFLLLFGLTLVPYNAMHKHEHDAHVAAMFNEQELELHHCELDELACQVSLLHECEHKNHITETHPDCFSCTFHFIKSYQSAQVLFNHILKPNFVSYCFKTLPSNTHKLPAETNRGPPTSPFTLA
ncbi:MAG: hypothetical protein MH472_07850 [Bacteroidia bacterium]|nr:hypothetical protein [Bacteroidia bacterium]